MNIALTYFCNQRCSYCFGKDAMSIQRGSPESREMTQENLYTVMRFMKHSRQRQFCMIGGEPTLHSRFQDMYDAVLKNGFSVMLFSNGVIDKNKVDFLSRKDNLDTILLNIREPKEYTPADWEKITYTLSRLHKKITLSFRVYKLNFNPGFLFDLIDAYTLTRLINWAIACPSLVARNEFIRLEGHEKVVERMARFSRESRRRKIRWYSDSGFIWCAFSGGKLETLRKNVDFVPITNCYPAIEVAPDLRVFRCYGLAPASHKELKITDFKNLREAERYFFKKSLPLKRVGGMEKCFACEHIISQKCGGGCMVYLLKEFPEYKKTPAIF